MLFGNAHIKTPLGKAFCKKVQACSVWHRRRDGRHQRILCSFGNQRICKDTRI